MWWSKKVVDASEIVVCTSRIVVSTNKKVVTTEWKKFVFGVAVAEDTCKFVQYHTSKMYNNPHKDSATINLCFKMACLLGRIQTSLALLSLHFAIATPKINFFHQIQVLVKNHTALFGKTHSRFCGKGCVIFGNGIAVFTLCASLCKAPIKMLADAEH